MVNKNAEYKTKQNKHQKQNENEREKKKTQLKQHGNLADRVQFNEHQITQRALHMFMLFLDINASVVHSPKLFLIC